MGNRDTENILRELRQCYSQQRKLQSQLLGNLPTPPPAPGDQPPLIPPSMAKLLEMDENERMTPYELARHLYDYIEENELRDKKNRHVIHPSRRLRKALRVEKGDPLDFFNFQIYLHDLYLVE